MAVLATRLLKPDELKLAALVFDKQLPYTHTFIANRFMPFNNVPVTVATINQLTYQVDFIIFWGEIIYNGSAAASEPETLIHELTHVWQGHHDKVALSYMVESMIAQGKAIWNHGNRNKAYTYDKTNYHNWSEYNVEQQASLVGDWFDARDGNQSKTDPRYPYITDNIRAGSISAKYVLPPAPPQQSLPAGAWPEIKAAQEVLFNLKYLTDRKYIDGYMGPKTKTALKHFQKRNGLNDDGLLGPHTLMKLNQPLHLLKGP
ncbi:MAG: peptidoglycan-binding protein [Acidobacteria bacterium]|nr:peptidoglycan-binding protein [Acidobacteriota bacterium]